jgi:hypothetical protein
LSESLSVNEADCQTLSPGQTTEALCDCRDDTVHDRVMADLSLAKRCLAGEVGAWEQLYSQCQGTLLAAIGNMLGPRGADLSLTDEIAARVWYALVANDGQLLERYGATYYEVGLTTFLQALAKNEIARYFRSETRRRKRECLVVTQESSRQDGLADDIDAALSEFLVTLTPMERRFARRRLLKRADQSHPLADAEKRLSARSYRRWASRIRRKLIGFLES